MVIGLLPHWNCFKEPPRLASRDLLSTAGNIDAARCTVARLMKQMGLKGAMRGKTVRTTIGDRTAPCPADRVNRQFQAPRPNAL